MTIDLDKLERLARAAFGVPWFEDPLFTQMEADEDHEIVVSPREIAHIAANSPTVTRAMVARIRELEAALLEVADLGAGATLSTDDVFRARASVLKGAL